VSTDAAALSMGERPIYFIQAWRDGYTRDALVVGRLC
jgi:hypothetical protein